MSAGRHLRPGLLVAIGTVLVLLCCSGGVVAFFLNASDDASDQTGGCGSTGAINVDAKLPNLGSLGPEQMRNAAIIISVGQQMKVPPRGWVIAVATAMQESRLRNLPNLGLRNDHDSLGLFQQRPSKGWGTVAQIMDPAYASRKFYEKLLTVAGWQTRALTEVAQTVQRSAYPDAYAKHESLASLVVNTLAGGAAKAVGNLTDLRCAVAGEDRRLRLDGAGQGPDRFRLPHRFTPHAPGRRHRRAEGHRRPRGGRGHGHPGALRRDRAERHRLGLRPGRLPAGRGLRLVRGHPPCRFLRDPLLPHGEPSARERRPAGVSGSADRLVRHDRTLLRAAPAFRDASSTAGRARIRPSIPYGSCKTWEHPSEQRRDELRPSVR